MLDELACLSRDLLIMKTAPKAGLSMLSGITDEQDAKNLAGQFASGELLRIIEVIQNTLSGFTRSESRRMDAELCLMTLCQPQLQLDAQSINARLTRLEENLQNLDKIPAAAVKKTPPVEQNKPETATKEPVKQEEAPEIPKEAPVHEQAPIGFWADVVSAVRKELSPMVSGCFVVNDNAQMVGVLQGDKLILRCKDTFTFNMINKPDVLEIVGRKASGILKRNVSVQAVDATAQPQNSDRMERLMDFGRAHSDIVHIKES